LAENDYLELVPEETLILPRPSPDLDYNTVFRGERLSVKTPPAADLVVGKLKRLQADDLADVAFLITRFRLTESDLAESFERLPARFKTDWFPSLFRCSDLCPTVATGIRRLSSSWRGGRRRCWPGAAADTSPGSPSASASRRPTCRRDRCRGGFNVLIPCSAGVRRGLSGAERRTAGGAGVSPAKC
jgi:hypothetical protein